MNKYLRVGLMMAVLIIVYIIGNYAYNLAHTIFKDSTKDYKITDSYIKPDLDYLETYNMTPFETSLPIIMIDTHKQQIIKEEKIVATAAVLSKGDPLISIFQEADFVAQMTIKARGASSYSHFDKQQYRIEFMKDVSKKKELDYGLFGMGEHSEWVLNGPFLDRTLIRNHLVYSLSREILDWAPDSRYCELFIDGEYQGVYLAIEPVTNGDNRLNLSKFALSSGITPYVVKRDRPDTEATEITTYGEKLGHTKNQLSIDYPAKPNLTQPQIQWIIKDISRFDEVIYSKNYTDPIRGYAKYIDVDSFVDYFIINEVVLNHDAGALSTYYYKEINGKLKMSIWDYNNAFDNNQWSISNYEGFTLTNTPYFDQLLKDRAFLDKVMIRYQKLRLGVLSTENMFDAIDSDVAYLSEAINRNFSVWGYSFQENLKIGPEPKNYKEAVSMLKASIKKRFDFLDNNLNQLYNNTIN